MEISVKWFDGQYPQFNVSIASKPGNEPFLEVKGCRIVSGKDGEFVAPPSTKGKNDKYWNHAYFSKDFAAVVLEKAKECQPQKQQAQPAQKQTGGFSDMESDIPFMWHGHSGAGVSWRNM
jgi:DNA-binding cell septation regulator SpoVG